MRQVTTIIGCLFALLAIGCLTVDAADKNTHEETSESLATRLVDVEARFRQRWGGLTPEELAPPEVAEDENQALIVIRAAKEIQDTRSPERTLRSLSGDLTEHFDINQVRDQATEIEIQLVRYKEALTLLDQIHRRGPANYQIDYESYGRSTGVHGTSLLDVGRLLTARALLSVARGQNEDALADVQRMFVISHSFASEPDGILQLLRVNLNRDALGVVRALLASPTLPKDGLGELQHSIGELGTPEAIRQFFRSELLFTLRLIDTMGEEYRMMPDYDHEVEQALVSARLQWIDFMDRWLEYALTSPWHRGELPELNYESLTTGTVIDAALPLMYSLGSGNWTQFILRCDVNRDRRGIAIVAIALERYAADHGGAFPKSVEDLRPFYLDSPPTDPENKVNSYSPANGSYTLVASDETIAAWDIETRDAVLDWTKAGK